MEEKGARGLPSVLSIPNSISLFELDGFIIPFFFLSAAPPPPFDPSPMIDT